MTIPVMARAAVSRARGSRPSIAADRRPRGDSRAGDTEKVRTRGACEGLLIDLLPG